MKNRRRIVEGTMTERRRLKRTHQHKVGKVEWKGCTDMQEIPIDS